MPPPPATPTASNQETRAISIRRGLKIVLFNLALFGVLIELVALAGYYYRRGTVYYLDPPTGRTVPARFESAVETYRIHPYLGFIIRPSAASGTRAGTPGDVGGDRYNNYGFDTPLDYPYRRRRPEELIVGIFGGSAADKLALFEAREKILSRLLADFLGREPGDITLLNLAQGGFKQPQQLLIYTYFRALGQDLDLVVNLDGFNDVALATHNARAGVAIDMPSIEHIGTLQELTAFSGSAGDIERSLRVRGYWAKYRQMANRAWSGEAWELRFAAGFMVDWLIYRLYHRRYLASRLQAAGTAGPVATGARASWLYLNQRTAAPAAGDDRAIDDAAAMDRAVELWAEASEMMHRAARQDEALYLHFVQPNQYYETARIFSAAERRVAWSEGSPYRELVPLGYPRLEAEVERLRRQGIPVEGLFRLLDPVAEPVYVDDCCHFTDAGQRVLARHIGEAAVAALSRRARSI